MGDMQIRGNVFGGQQPVAHATVQLYAAGRTGNASAASSELLQPVSSDDNGNFSLTGTYACQSTEDQVYLVASGGNPGLSAGTNNAALVLMNALGRCGDLLTTQFVSLNELTTVAAVWAVAPFMKSATLVGATSTNAAGLRNAFLNAHLLADPNKGLLAALPANLSIETGKLYALANALAACVNSNGAIVTGSSPSTCGTLFTAATPPGGTAPTNTLSAALNIVKNPGNNVALVFNTISAQAPFPNLLTRAPSDWTMSLTVTGGNVNAPTSLAVDADGNVWVASFYGLLSAFSPQGTPLTSSGYGMGTLSESYGLVVDHSNDVWVTIEEQPRHSPTYGSVAKFAGASTSMMGTLLGTYFDTSIDYPYALSADTNGNILVDNYANSSATVISANGVVVRGGLALNNAAAPTGIAADQAHGVWLANSADNTITHVAADGTLLARPACCNGANGLALDALGNAWATNYFGKSVSEVSAAGVTTLTTASGAGGVQNPSGIVIDGAQDVWVANYRGTSFSHIAGNGGAVPAGTALSPATGLGQDAALVLPYGIALDPTGNVWISNFSNNDLVMFFGLAAPTRTPVLPAPSIP